MKKTSVKLQINESALIRNLKFAFSNAYTVMTEILQNCRRAGATKVEITTTEVKDGKLNVTIVDDGIGIDDFQKLLTVAESGWDENTVKNESPFGMGFLSAIFSASRVVVQSRGRTLDIDTENIMSMNDVHVSNVSSFTGKGTSVTLYDVKESVIKSLEKLVKGFSLPVLYNGAFIERSNSVDSRYIQTEIGLIKFDLDVVTALLHHTPNSALYLQEFEVWRQFGHGQAAVICHLDSKSHHGRLPDRDKLVNEDEVVKHYHQVLNAEIEKQLLKKLVEMGEKKFCEKYGGYVSYNHPLILLKLENYLPAAMTSWIEELSLNSYLRRTLSDKVVTLESLKSGEIMLFDKPEFYEDTEDLPMMQYIQHREGTVFLKKQLPVGHWANEFVKSNEPDAFSIEVIGEGKSATFNGDVVCPRVVLCDEVRLSFKGDVIVITQSGIVDGNTIYIPVQANDCGYLVGLLSEYTKEYDELNEEAYDNDSSALVRVVRQLRSQDFAYGIREAINSEDIPQIDGIAGRQYVVLFKDVIEKGYYKNNVDVVEIHEVLAKLGVDVSSERFKAAVQEVISDKAVK